MPRIYLVLIAFFLAACNNSTPTQSTNSFLEQETTNETSLSHIVSSEGLDPKTTALLIIRLSDGQKWTVHNERLNQRFSPASTSKIPHTLIALETQFAQADTVFKWDGRPRNFKSWNQDQTLLSAYQRSAVWVYQNITSNLGKDVMSNWLTLFDYGNFNIGNAESIRSYWLGEPLKISASEQVAFLTHLSQETLPLSENTYEASSFIFQADQKGVATLYAKTGWMYDENKTDIGWYVGWVHKVDNNETYVFAFNMDMEDGSLRHKRKTVVMKALRSINAWPEE